MFCSSLESNRFPIVNYWLTDFHGAQKYVLGLVQLNKIGIATNSCYEIESYMALERIGGLP